MERTIWKGVYLTMATTEKIRRDIEKVREKITEQQKRLRALEAQLAEEENLEIVRMVKAVHMDNRELTAFLRAYASGMISLPEGMMERRAPLIPIRWRVPMMRNKHMIRTLAVLLAVMLCMTAFPRSLLQVMGRQPPPPRHKRNRLTVRISPETISPN